jgi:hypothetical protein
MKKGEAPMDGSQGKKVARAGVLSAAFAFLSRQWEVVFFLLAFILLFLQVIFFTIDVGPIAPKDGAIAVFASIDSFIINRLSYLTTPGFLLPLTFLLFCPVQPGWARRYLDIIGIYVVTRMAIQLVGLNVLVFDTVSSRFFLVTQLLFFLPYSLLVWGWIYWRLDQGSKAGDRGLFRLDLDGRRPRPVDYFVASFSSVFSASISAIKGTSARARILILAHGFVIYDVMGLTLSRAISLVQSQGS